MMKCDMWHTICGCRKIIGGIIWVAGFISLVFAWVAMSKEVFLGYDPLFWLFNAVALGVLATPLKLYRHHGKGMACCEKDVKMSDDVTSKCGECCIKDTR